MVAIFTLVSLALVAFVPSVQAVLGPSATPCTTSYTCPYAAGSSKTTFGPGFVSTTLTITGAVVNTINGNTLCRIYANGVISGTNTASVLTATYTTGSLLGSSPGSFSPANAQGGGAPLVTAPPTEPSSTGPAGCTLARRARAIDRRQAVRPTVTGGKVVARPKQTQINGAREDQKSFWKKSRAGNARIR